MFTKNFKSSDTFEVFFTPENELTTSIMEKTCEELRQSFITYDWTGRKKISKDFVARAFQNEKTLEVRSAPSSINLFSFLQRSRECFLYKKKSRSCLTAINLFGFANCDFIIIKKRKQGQKFRSF